MYSRPVTTTSPKGAARRRLIIETATRLIARNGSRGTSLAQIAHESGVSQPGLIYYFPTKDDLLHAALDERDAAEEAALAPTGDELSLFDTIVASVATWESSPEAVGMHTVLVAENVGQDGSLRPRLTERYHATVDRFASLLRAAQERGAIRADVDTGQKAMEIIAFVNGLETAWLLNPDVPAARIAAQWAADQRAVLATSAASGSHSTTSRIRSSQ